MNRLTVLGAGAAPASGGGGGGFSFVTHNEFIAAGGAQTKTIDVTGAVAGDILIVYDIDPAGAPTYTAGGGGAISTVTGGGQVDGTLFHTLKAKVLTSGDISTPTITVSSGKSANYPIDVVVIHGGASVVAKNFQGPVTGNVTFSSWTPAGNTLAAGIILHSFWNGGADPAGTGTIGPGTWTADFRGVASSEGFAHNGNWFFHATSGYGAGEATSGLNADNNEGFEFEVTS